MEFMEQMLPAPGYMKNLYESCGLNTILFQQSDLQLFYTSSDNLTFRGELFDII